MSDFDPTPNQRIFVAALAKLVDPMRVVEASNALLAMLPGLAHLPDNVFDRPQSLAQDVAQDMDRVPTFSKLRKALEGWREKNKGLSPAFSAPGVADLASADLSAEDRMNVQIWLEHHANGDLSEGEMIGRLSVIRRYARKGYRWLLAQHTDAAMAAADIAVKQRWVDDEHKWAPPSEEEREAVAETVRGRFPTAQQSSDLRADDGRVSVAPSNSSVAISPQPIIMPDGRAAGALSETHLRAYREANLTLREVQEREDAAKVTQAGRLPWWREEDQ